MANSKLLYLYKNITPNVNKYYYTTSLSALGTKLASNLITTLSPDKYTYNSNIFKINVSGSVTEALKYRITYIIENEYEGTTLINIRAWHVNSIIYQSGFVILNCSVDLWGTYIYKASISNLNVKRCNRNIGVGLLDNLAGTKGSKTKSYCLAKRGSTTITTGTNNEKLKLEEAWIVFALKYNTFQTSNGALGRIGLFGFRLDDLKTTYYNKVQSGGGDATDLLNAECCNPIELALDVVGGIYGIKGYNGFGFLTTLDAEVIGCWLSPLFTYSSSETKVVTTPKWKYMDEDIELYPKEGIPAEFTITLSVTNDFDKQFYLGTIENGLKLQRTTETTISCDFKIYLCNDKITFIMQQGDTQLDVTEGFKVTLGTAAGDITAGRDIATAVESFLKVAGSGFSMVKGAVTGNAVALGLGITNFTGSLTDALDNTQKQHIGAQVNGGDGVTAFYTTQNGSPDNTHAVNMAMPVTNPFVLNAYASIDNEKANARMFGASFNELTDIATVLTASLLGTGTFTDTLIKASCWVDGIPTDAAEYIKNCFERGIYIEKLT